MKTSLIKKHISDNILKGFLKVTELPTVEKDSVVAAIDIGYGFTKYATIGAGGKIDTNLFPSMPALSPQTDLSGGFFTQRDTKTISSGGTDWEVGPDVGEIATKTDVRALHEDFIKSEQWKILLLGALAYMGKKKVDYLVLGLPVNNMKKSAEMIELAKGDHTIDGVKYTVNNVLVIPQPLGSLYNYAVKGNDFERFSKTNTLIIDPGYLTFDFLVTKGFSVNAHRSGARPGGMSNILNAISTSIAKDLGIEYDDANEIDDALNLKDYDGVQEARPIFIYGQEVDLNKHIKATVPVIETSLHFMLNKIGDNKDVSQIIMAGGPNKIFERSIKKQFPHHSKGLKTLDDGIFGNVTGFMLWGMMMAHGETMQ